jgi:hypothetical protein
MAAPYYEFKDAGAHITLASPKGCRPRSIPRARIRTSRRTSPVASRTWTRRPTPGHGGPPKPYKPVAVTLPQPYNDPSFEAFRKELGEIASHKDRAALASKIVANDFFWMGEKGDKASKRKSGIDNLAAAIGLDSADGVGWETLAAAADEATLAPIPDKKGVMCSPAGPVSTTRPPRRPPSGTQREEWGFPVSISCNNIPLTSPTSIRSNIASPSTAWWIVP